MKKVLIILVLITLTLQAQSYNKFAKYSLFTDQKASQIGDIITILVVESNRASNNAQTNGSRVSDFNFSGNATMGGNDLMPSVSGSVGTGNDFAGKGGTETSGMVRTRISATVDSVFANGNLRIKGKKQISIYGEEQTIIISGVIRPSDIQGQNIVESSAISDAKIEIEGSGMIDRMQSPGWLTKLFHWLF